MTNAMFLTQKRVLHGAINSTNIIALMQCTRNNVEREVDIEYEYARLTSPVLQKRKYPIYSHLIIFENM